MHTCGRCRLPLTLRTTAASESLLSVRESTYDLLASHIATAAAAGDVKGLRTAEDRAFYELASGSSAAATPLLPGRTVPPLPKPHAANNSAAAQQALFDALSAQSEIDFPLCTDCADAWFAQLTKANDARKEERRVLQQYEKDVKEKQKEYANSGNDLEKETQRLKEEEEALIRELLEAEQEKDALDEEMRQLDADEKQLEEEESQFWLQHSRYLIGYNAQVQKSRSLLHSYNSTLSTLEKLQRTNVYADAFNIGHDGGLATINGLRLGRLPSVPVDWTEINAAWGCTLLLLKTIARKIGCEIVGYRLVPMGSFSRIERLSQQGEKSTALELYGSGDWALGRYLLNRRFDAALVAFLECLRQVIDFAEERAMEQNVDFRIPHHVVKDKIGDVSIKLGNSDEVWTRALRHVLLDLKILLADAVR